MAVDPTTDELVGVLRSVFREEPLPASLRQRLYAVAAVEDPRDEEPALARSSAEELPEALRGRLLAIPRRSADRPAVPEYLRSSGWAVAVSYVVAALLLFAVGDPVRWSRHRIDEVWRSVGGALPAVGTPTTAAATAAAVDLRRDLQALHRGAWSRLESSAVDGRDWAGRALDDASQRATARLATMVEAVAQRATSPPPASQRSTADGASPRRAPEEEHDDR